MDKYEEARRIMKKELKTANDYEKAYELFNQAI